MKPILLLIDLQQDYLRAPGIEPAAGFLIERCAALLRACRQRQIPVVHVWTTVDRRPDTRMPHWVHAGKWRCVRETPGHQPPPELQPTASEPIAHKRFFSAFGAPTLAAILRESGADTLWLAGVHLHACLRATALDAYQHGFQVTIVDDAVGSDDPVHAAITRRYLASRGARFCSVAELLATSPPTHTVTPVLSKESPVIRRQSPAHSTRELTPIPIARASEVAAAVERARQACPDWAARSPVARAEALARLAEGMANDPSWASAIAEETGKPIRFAREEAAIAVAQVHALVRRLREEPADAPAPHSNHPYVRRRPLGVVALVTPWNNPLFLPLGKLGAAVAHGNTVVWKPAPAGSDIAAQLLQHWDAAGFPMGVLNLLTGDRATAEALLSHPGIDAVSLTGSLSAGYAAQEICARRHIPLQAELGGNNGAVVWSDADLPRAAALIAEGAFAQAGQRCTANRRAIVDRTCLPEFLQLLSAATARLPLGDPLDPQTIIGPLISAAHRNRIRATLDRARTRPEISFVSPTPPAAATPEVGAYLPPTVVVCEHPDDELVQEELFGPVLVIQPADTWAHALELCNGVRQGLVAAVFTTNAERQQAFLTTAQAGILKVNQSTAGAAVDLPFGGWKASGLGPPEHGEADREFYTRIQTVYP